MKIVVCLKQVPDMESKFKIIEDTKIDESQIAFKINDFDNFAVEAALQLKQKNGGEVIIVSSGPARAAKDIRQAFAMGADWGIHINDDAVEAGDSFVVASALAKAIESIGDVDLVLTGVQSEDVQAGVTGTMIADMLGMAHLTNVVKLDSDGSKLDLNRELTGGFNEVVEVAIPAVLSVQSGLNEPRYPTLPGIMKAKKKKLEAKTAADLGSDTASKTELLKRFFPQVESNCEMIDGDGAAQGTTLVDKLKNEAKVI